MDAKIRIISRLRPLLPGEQMDDGCVSVVSGDDPDSSNTSSSSSSSTSARSYVNVLDTQGRGRNQKYHFTAAYGPTSTHAEIYTSNVRPLIDVVYTGVTATIFAYGVTSSGKTHTMQGTKENPGLIPRAVSDVLARRTQILDQETNVNIELNMSYMELYKEDAYDLLVKRENATKLPVNEDAHGRVFVRNLNTVQIETIKDFESVFGPANRNRSMASTNLNHASSRSHAILSIDVIVTREEGTMRSVTTGKLNLVDLAGSENNKKTGNDPARMAESAAINKSLATLGQVVRDLNSGQPRIPYRNSKLTRILQDALGGRSLGLVICNLAPGAKFLRDTLNTLNFAHMAREIENKVTTNVTERDVKPLPRGRQSLVPPPPVLAPLPVQRVLQPSAAAKSNNTKGPRPSLVPILKPGKGPRYSRLSGLPSFGHALAGGSGAKENDNQERSLGLTEKDIDERISKAVEAEVARRLAEREKELQQQQAANEEEGEEGSPQRSPRRSPRKNDDQPALPSGVLTPLLKRHQDLDDELQRRFRELEEKYEQNQNQNQDPRPDIFSPVSRKKTGRAYVALARVHSEKGDLPTALELYRKAATYVPDNIKLKERIIEIEWAVKNNTEFVPSPKKEKPKRAKKGKKAPTFTEVLSDDQMEVDEVAVALSFGPLDMGLVRTPVKSGKRTRDTDGEGSPLVMIESDDDDEEDERARQGGSLKRIRV